MHQLKRLVFKITYLILRLYWFFFRPHTYGAKVVIERDGKALLVKHSYGSRVWCFPGGGQKHGESFEVTAKRETKEEVGLDLVSVEFIGNFISEYEYKHDHVHVFLARASEGEVQIDGEEIVSYEWVTHGAQKVWTLNGERIWQMYLAHKTT